MECELIASRATLWHDTASGDVDMDQELTSTSNGHGGTRQCMIILRDTQTVQLSRQQQSNCFIEHPSFHSFLICCNALRRSFDTLPRTERRSTTHPVLPPHEPPNSPLRGTRATKWTTAHPPRPHSLPDRLPPRRKRCSGSRNTSWLRQIALRIASQGADGESNQRSVFYSATASQLVRATRLRM